MFNWLADKILLSKTYMRLFNLSALKNEYAQILLLASMWNTYEYYPMRMKQISEEYNSTKYFWMKKL